MRTQPQSNMYAPDIPGRENISVTGCLTVRGNFCENTHHKTAQYRECCNITPGHWIRLASLQMMHLMGLKKVIFNTDR